jgi:hypothetical protein
MKEYGETIMWYIIVHVPVVADPEGNLIEIGSFIK